MTCQGQSWSSQLSSRAGEIVPFATRKILLLLTLYAMDLPAVKAGIELCEFGTHFGVKGMTGSFNVVHNMTNASVSLLSSIWKSTTEFMGVVQIEQPEYSRGADADLDKKKLRNVTAAHVRAITNYVDNVNRDTGQVRFPVLPPPPRHPHDAPTPHQATLTMSVSHHVCVPFS